MSGQVRQIEDCLCRNAASCPDKVALICGAERLTYARLWQAVQARARQLEADGLQRGAAWLLTVRADMDFLIDYCAVHWAGGVAVPLEAGLPEVRRTTIARQTSISAIPLGTADILFTTGTTGTSKGVMIGHDALLADAENLAGSQGYSSQLTFIICGPLSHLGSLSKVWPVWLTAGTVCLTPGLKDPGVLFAAMRRPDSRYATFLVPAALRMLMSLCESELQAHAADIEFIETGGAPMAQADMERLCRLLPGSRLYNTYASTEAGIVCTHDFNAGKCVEGCLGRPMRHSRVSVSSEGKVMCHGRTLMTGYVGDSQATASVLRDGVLYTSDSGRLDAEGMLCLAGRTDDVINVGGFKVDPSEVESAALSLPEVADCVCVAAPHPLTGAMLKLLVVLRDGAALDRQKLARHIRTRLEAYKVPMAYEVVEAVCRTFNGKIDRKAYR